MNYFNTTNLEGSELIERRTKVSGQEKTILGLFKRFEELTPFDALYFYPEPKPPITSIRRGITNLTKAGFLIKTDRKVIGNYGHVNYQWVLNSGKQLEIGL